MTRQKAEELRKGSDKETTFGKIGGESQSFWEHHFFLFEICLILRVYKGIRVTFCLVHKKSKFDYARKESCHGGRDSEMV